MKYLLLLIVVGLSSCAQEDQKYAGTPTNEYDYVLEQFNSDMVVLGRTQINFSKAVIRKGKLGGSTQAYCYQIAKKWEGPTNISIQSGISKKQAEIYIYHEIGHCYLGLQHNQNYSLMTDLSLPITRMYVDFHTSAQKRQELLKIMLEEAGI